MPTFAASSMLSVGIRFTIRQIVEPLRDVVGVLMAVAANFLLVPALAVGIVRLIPLETPMAVGLIVVASAAGAPMVVKLAQLSRQPVSFAASVLVLLLLGTILYMPLVIPRLSPGAPVRTMAIAMPLIVTMLVPLGIGFVLRAIRPGWAEALLPFAGRVTNVALWTMIGATVLGNLRAVLGVFGTGAIGAALLLIAGAFVLGFVAGTVDKRERIVLGFATAQRNFAAATVVAVESFTDPRVLVMAVVCSTIAMLLIPFAGWVGRRLPRRGEPIPEGGEA